MRARSARFSLSEGRGAPYLEIELAAGARVDGRVVDLEGRPLQGVALSAREDAGGAGLAPPGSVPLALATSDEHGRFVLADLPPGVYRLRASEPRHACYELPLEVPSNPAHLDAGELALGAGGRVAGLAEELGGAPVPGALIILRADRQAAVPLLELQTRTGADGTYAFEHVPIGRYLVSAQRAGFGGGAEPELVQIDRDEERVLHVAEGVALDTVDFTLIAP